MDHPFIQLMCESFYNDYKSHLGQVWKDKSSAVNELKSYLFNLMENVKIEDESLYFSLHEDFDYGEKQQILYRLIDEYIREQYDKSDPPEDKEYKSPEEFLLESALSPATDMYHMLYNGAAAVPTITFTPMTILFGGGLAILAIVGFWKQLSRAQWSVCTALHYMNKQISELISKATRTGKVKNIILQNNVESCWRKCNLSPKDLSKTVGIALERGYFATPNSEKQADCLSMCYLNWTLQQVNTLAKSYVSCLQTTGERTGELNDLNIFLQRPAGQECSNYYDVLKKHYEDYIDVIEVLFRNEDQLKEEWKRKYHVSLNDGLSGNSRPIVGKPISGYRTPEFSKQSGPQFGSQKPKPGQGQGQGQRQGFPDRQRTQNQ